MKPTSPSAPDRPSWIRVATAALIAGIVAAVLAAMAGPSAVAATSGQHAGSPVAVATTEDPITVDDLVQLVDDFEATGEVTFAGALRMRFVLRFVQHDILRGNPDLAIDNLGKFKDLTLIPRYTPSELARDVLIAAADELIEQLR